MSRKVLCSECGFLCWHVWDESGESWISKDTVARLYRKRFQDGESDGLDEPDYPNERYRCNLGCLRGLWRWSFGSEKVDSEHVNPQELRKPRSCRYYIEFEPECSPEEHKVLQRDERTNRLLLKATLLGAGVGGAIGFLGTLFAQWLIHLFGWLK